MVDVSAKNVTARTAVACATVWLPDNVMKLLDSQGEMRSSKGPVFATAIIAGTMACKRTHELIPFCHPLGLESCKFRIVNSGKNEISIEATASISGKTGVEMEALTAVRYSAVYLFGGFIVFTRLLCSVAALTVYDMCKALSHDIVIKDIKLISKSGGKSDFRGQSSAGPS
jgi:cyclic pyranopterin phosphate synthase